MKHSRIAAGALFACLAFIAAGAARAETDIVRIVQPYGLVYLPSYVVVERQLIEKHAKAMGLGAIKVTLTRVSSGPVGSDLLLAN